MPLLFSYGTLQFQNIQLALYKRNPDFFSDSISGYSIISISLGGEKYPALIPSNNSSTLIKGNVYNITEDELAITDEYEGDAYKRILQKLASGKEAWLYILA